jgi:hypothetical protein
MSTNRLYHTWLQRICELRPHQRITQIRNFVWLMIGIYESRSVTLSKIACKIPGSAQLLSTVKRLSRFLENPAIRVREWYEPMAKQWLQSQAACLGEIRLIVDGTKIGFSHQLLLVSVAYRRRAIPITWTWIPHVKGHSSAYKQLALLNHVRQLLPGGIGVFLPAPVPQVQVVGDCEFGSVEVLKWLDSWHWFYALRQKSDTGLWLASSTEWKPFRSFIQKPGQSFWLGRGYLTAQEIYPVNLLVHWDVGEEEPWCLATNLPDQEITLRGYRRRAWCEEFHGDIKKHGFDLESTLLHSFEKLSRLTLAVAFLYIWLMAVGGQVIHAGHRPLVDRHDRRDLSIFQIGLRFIERRLTNELPVQVSLVSYL